MKRLALFLLLAGLFLPGLRTAHAQGDSPLVLVITADGPLTPAMREYLKRSIGIAEQRGAETLILQLNTPGGSIDLMTEMVQIMRASSVPVVVYVMPNGAMAGSAGTVITLAGHAAAMAPETMIGAASPVGSQGEDLGATLDKKIKEATKALTRSLAERRGAEAVALAESTIDDARAVSASEALEAGLVDFIATSLDDLLAQLDGFTVKMAGASRPGDDGAVTEDLPMSLSSSCSTSVNPNIVFLLVTIGVQAILIELSSPGGWVAGFTGLTCLALAAYGLGVLPVNWFGALFIIVSFVLFVLDVKAPTHGALTAAGIGSFILGALVLFNSPGVPQFQRVSVPLVIGVGIITGILFALVVGFAIRAQKVPIRTGVESMIHKSGIARTDIDPTGQLQAGSELWTAELAEGAGPIRAGENAEIVEVKGCGSGSGSWNRSESTGVRRTSRWAGPASRMESQAGQSPF
jgi:membrane-bound serine protease (ClpP class)